jgi:uncharacterized protein (TIGR03000 family)
MKICVAGAAGAFGIKHLDAIAAIDGIEVVSVVGHGEEAIRALAHKRGIAHWATDLAQALEHPAVQAVILSTPTQLHASQAIECLQAGKHVMVEIPMADNLADAERSFNTPALEPGLEYRYEMKIEYVRDGKTISDVKSVNVQAGRLSVVEFAVSFFLTRTRGRTADELAPELSL